MNYVRFFTNEGEGIRLDWPASTSWYRFLSELHKRLAEADRITYDDKDIIFIREMTFENTMSGYQHLSELHITFIRFNERGNNRPGGEVEKGIRGRRYIIKLAWSGHIVKGFEYVRSY